MQPLCFLKDKLCLCMYPLAYYLLGFPPSRLIYMGLLGPILSLKVWKSRQILISLQIVLLTGDTVAGAGVRR